MTDDHSAATVTTPHAEQLAVQDHRPVGTTLGQTTNQSGWRESVQADSSAQYGACLSGD